MPSLAPNAVYLGDCRRLLPMVERESVALSLWSPPYFVGKSYERDLSFAEWQALLREVLRLHHPLLRPGGFVVVNIADILAFPDPALPRFQGDVVSGKRCPVTREAILALKEAHPEWGRYQLAAYLGCSEQTIDRRLKGNNARGGKRAAQTKVLLVGGMLQAWAEEAGLYLYDRRIWVKDPAWNNSRWHSTTYRAVDEFEYLYFFWKPGPTKVDRKRLTAEEWATWGSRAVWRIPSVRRNDDHEAKFPRELPWRIIRLLTDPGDLVLDPFLGSGTTAVLAIELGRSFLGMEKEPEYFHLAQRNIAKAMAQPALFWESLA